MAKKTQKKTNILTIGTATRDVFVRGPGLKAMTDPHFNGSNGFPTGRAECLPLGSKLELESVTLTTGGGATNAAVTFARQGFAVDCVAEVGEDDIARDIERDLKKEGVRPRLSVNKKLGTAYSTLLLTAQGERTVLVYRGAANGLTYKEVPLSKLKPEWVYISPGSIPFITINKLVIHFKKKGAHIAMNPSSYYLKLGAKKLRPLLNKLDVVIMNREEAASLTGVDYENEKKIFRILDDMVEGIAVMTEGPEGVRVSNGSTVFQAGTFRDKGVQDRTGAGDAFGSGFVARFAQAGDLSADAIEQAIRLASANATSVVEHIGAKKGILTKSRFERDARWRRLAVTRSELS